jgi:hypothetical protein
MLIILAVLAGCGSEEDYSASQIVKIASATLQIFADDFNELQEYFDNVTIDVFINNNSASLGAGKNSLIIRYVKSSDIEKYCINKVIGCYDAPRRIYINEQYLASYNKSTKFILVHEMVHYLLYIKYTFGDINAIAQSYNHEMPYFDGAFSDINGDCYINDVVARL